MGHQGPSQSGEGLGCESTGKLRKGTHSRWRGRRHSPAVSSDTSFKTARPVQALGTDGPLAGLGGWGRQHQKLPWACS